MYPLLRKFLGLNWILFLLMVALLAFGVFAIYSATWMREAEYLVTAWRKQATWIGIGLVVYFAVSLIDYKWTLWGSIPIYLAGVAFLVLTRFKGRVAGGARSWLEIGPVNFQPSQMALLGGIMVIALILVKLTKLHPFLRICLCGVVVAVPCGLIILQPDLGSTIVWVPIFLVMLFVGGIPIRYLLVIVLLGVLALPVIYNFGLEDYQQRRITTFMHPERDPLGDGWTINQSLTAIGSGGLEGKGFKAPNTLNELGFLPSTIVHNDFIFSVIGEQHGFIGGTILVSVFAVLLLTMLFIAYLSRDLHGSILAGGVIGLVFTHVFMNIGMTISVTPITGLPLPMISYGGTFALLIMFCLGVLQSIWVHRKPEE